MTEDVVQETLALLGVRFQEAASTLVNLAHSTSSFATLTRCTNRPMLSLSSPRRPVCQPPCGSHGHSLVSPTVWSLRRAAWPAFRRRTSPLSYVVIALREESQQPFANPRTRICIGQVLVDFLAGVNRTGANLYQAHWLPTQLGCNVPIDGAVTTTTRSLGFTLQACQYQGRGGSCATVVPGE